ncbi:MAG: ribonuclease III [Gammaproteobacteria bacterium]|nr:ribonuclease III [Gammaproteobacteria bacterium]MDH5303259.1 ribonuclease III [Gammaproteobacteria bacterium]MDH5322039.1 ribonuclease III [Gammaproteobacteria bacterium]
MWLTQKLSYEFNDPRLLQQALTHRSSPGDNNERLEFLGDAVLDLVVSDCVFNARRAAAEGDLSRLRASLVNKSSLAEIATELGLSEYLILGEGERKTGGHRRESILADALEALFGAVYLDSGFAAAEAVIRRVFDSRLKMLPANDELRDPKTRLQEWLQSRAAELPHYELLKTSGKAHRQLFEVCCSIKDGELQSTGYGTSRRNAEQQAAENMLALLAAADAG